MLIAVGLWTGHDAASKWLATSYPVLVVLFWRDGLNGMVDWIGRASWRRRS